MTGMTDISRHGGDKKHRDGFGIQVKDDALIDPALLGVTSDDVMQTGNLVDDSDDDSDYEFRDSGPGMAAKVVQAGFKLLFFPMILAYRGVMSLRHTPWLCKQIVEGIKNGTATLKRIAGCFLSFFSPNGRLGKVLIVIGTLTGVIWLTRKIQGFRCHSSYLTENSEVKIPESEVRSPKPEGHHKATATVQFSQSPQQTQQQPDTIAANKPQNQILMQVHAVVPEPEHEEPKSRRKIGFGQLSKLASAFKRSEPITSPHTASLNNEDHYDSFEATDNRWSMKKSGLFAASCIALLIGGATVAMQVMHKNNDVAQKTPDEVSDRGAGIQEPESMDPKSEGISQNPETIPPAPQNDFSFFSNTGGGASNFNSFDNSGNIITNNTVFSESIPSASPEIPPWQDTGMQPVIANNFSPGNQGGTALIQTIDDPEEQVVDNQQSIATHSQPQPGSDVTGYDNSIADAGYDNKTAITKNGQFGNSPFVTGDSSAHSQESSGYINDLPSSLDATPVVQPQSTLVAVLTPVTPSPSIVENQNPLAAASQPESSLLALTATPRVRQDRNTPAPMQNNLQTPVDSENTSDNSTSAHPASSDTGLTSMAISTLTHSASSTANSNLISLSPMNSASINLDSHEQDTWVASPQESPMTQLLSQQDSVFGITQIETPVQTLPYNQILSQQDSVFGITQIETPVQTLPYNQNPEPLVAPVSPAATNATGSFVNLEASEIPATSPLDTLSGMGVPPPQMQTQAQATPSPMSIQPAMPSTMPLQNMEAQTQPVNMSLPPQATMMQQIPARPVNVQPAIAQPTATPVTFPGVTQDNNSDIATGGIVSPSQHIAAMPMISSDTPASFISNDMPPVAANATTAPAYSSQPQSFQNTQATQQYIPQATSALLTSNSLNSVYIVQPGDSIYKIAKQELGSVRRYREIYELNRDRLPTSVDTLTTGMELLLPAAR